MIHKLMIVCGFIFALDVIAQSHYSTPGEPLDYGTLSHKLTIELLRAGSHDSSGTNNYYFQAILVGLLNATDERNLPLDKRKKIEIDLGFFANTTLDALNLWRPSEKPDSAKEIAVDGQQIRALVARVMSEMKVQESDVSIMLTLNLFEKEKILGFFGKDRMVATTSFYPVPPPLFESLFRTNTTLHMADDKGLEAKIAVRFDQLTDVPNGKSGLTPKSPQSTSTKTSLNSGTLTKSPP